MLRGDYKQAEAREKHVTKTFAPSRGRTLEDGDQYCMTDNKSPEGSHVMLQHANRGLSHCRADTRRDARNVAWAWHLLSLCPRPQSDTITIFYLAAIKLRTLYIVPFYLHVHKLS